MLCVTITIGDATTFADLHTSSALQRVREPVTIDKGTIRRSLGEWGTC